MQETAEFVTVTPELAAEWLERNTHNRRLRSEVVSRFANAIGHGEWQVNGDAIRFAIDGTLLDGQHRLAAIVKAKTAVFALVVRGLEMAAQETIDVGGKRTLSDMLKLRGEPLSGTLGAALGWLHRYRYNRMSEKSFVPTPQQAFDLLEATPRLRDSLAVGERLRNQLRFSAGLGAFFHYVFAEIDQGDADFFFERLTSGALLEETDAIFVLRRAIEKDAMAIQRMQQYRMAALVVRAWNAYRANQPVRILKWATNGPSAQRFPRPQ